MKVSYYPGCTLRTKAKQLDLYARKSAEALGITMEEIENWQCCGGVFSTAKDEIATKLSSVHALAEASSRGEAKDSALLSSRDVGLLEPPERQKDRRLLRMPASPSRSDHADG